MVNHRQGTKNRLRTALRRAYFQEGFGKILPRSLGRVPLGKDQGLQILGEPVSFKYLDSPVKFGAFSFQTLLMKPLDRSMDGGPNARAPGQKGRRSRYGLGGLLFRKVREVLDLEEILSTRCAASPVGSRRETAIWPPVIGSDEVWGEKEIDEEEKAAVIEGTKQPLGEASSVRRYPSLCSPHEPFVRAPKDSDSACKIVENINMQLLDRLGRILSYEEKGRCCLFPFPRCYRR